MGDYRDIQNGVNDPVNGVDVKRAFNDNQTPHERAQTAADRDRTRLRRPRQLLQAGPA